MTEEFTEGALLVLRQTEGKGKNGKKGKKGKGKREKGKGAKAGRKIAGSYWKCEKPGHTFPVPPVDTRRS